MKRIFGFLTVAAFAGMLFAANAFAQSSGSFNYSTVGTGGTAPIGCVVNSTNGTISGGIPCGPISSGGTACTTTSNCVNNATTTQTCQGAIACAAGCPTGSTCDVVSGFCSNTGICAGTASATCIGSTDVGMKTNSGNGNVFVVTPSAVIGLLTDVTVSSKQNGSSTGAVSSSAFAGVDFRVTIPAQPSSGTTLPVPNFPITYDSRFIQISTNLFQALSTACLAINGGCFITFNESTVSAHSFDWVLAPLTSGNYDVRTTWTSSLADFGLATSLTCVGPVNFTVQQAKIFKPSAEALTDIGIP